MSGTEFQDRVEKHLAEEMRRAWGYMLNDARGRLVIWSILEKAHIFQLSYSGNADTNFREGERNIGLQMLERHILPLGAEYLANMMAEHEERLLQIEAAVEKDMIDDG